MLLPHNPNAFARSPLDRAGHHRRDGAWLAQALSADTTRLIPFFQHRPFVVEAAADVEAGWLGSHTRARIAGAEAPTLFLGLDLGGAAHFAIDISDASPLAELGRFDDLRALGPRLSHDDLAILGCAKSIFEWHTRHGFCANCGAASVIVEAGWKRECPACKAEHFPRFDPVVIMLPTRGENWDYTRHSRNAWNPGSGNSQPAVCRAGKASHRYQPSQDIHSAMIFRASCRHRRQPPPMNGQGMTLRDAS